MFWKIMKLPKINRRLEKKAAMLQELEEAIAKKKKEVMSGDQYPTWESRYCEEFRQKIRKAADSYLDETEPGKPRRRLGGTDK